MKLISAVELGNDMGLTTVGESIFNVRMHAIQIFNYSDIAKEISELFDDFAELQKTHGITNDTLTTDVLKMFPDSQNSPESHHVNQGDLATAKEIIC